MSKKPNIIFILTDDQGAWAMHCAGNKELQTPNLDRIAAEGVRFDHFFCASPVCSPARASLMTGTIPSRHGVHDWLASGSVDAEKFAKQGKENPYGGYALERKPIQYLKDQITYTDLLSQNGYTCALSGKWHLGDSVTPQHGFSKWFTIGKGGCFYYHPDIVENGDITVRHGEYVTDIITDKAVDMLKELSNEKAPFYLSVHYTAPHSPWEEDQHPREYLDLYENATFSDVPDIPDHPDMTVGPVYGTPQRRINLRGYYAAITAMDAGVGKILDALRDCGQEENTMVIFSADNGMSMGHHGIWGKGNGTFPMNMFEQAVLVPFLMKGPLVKDASRVCSDMVSGYDFFPTILDIAGIENPCKEVLPGKSFLSSIQNNATQDDRDIVIFDEYGPVRMIRTRTWKYIHRYPYGPHELYNLEEDPGETINRYTDPECAQRIVEMRRKLHEWFITYRDPAHDGLFEGVTGSGQLCSAGTHSEFLNKYNPIPKTAKEKS